MDSSRCLAMRESRMSKPACTKECAIVSVSPRHSHWPARLANRRRESSPKPNALPVCEVSPAIGGRIGQRRGISIRVDLGRRKAIAVPVCMTGQIRRPSHPSGMGRFMSPDWSAKPEAVPYSSLGNPQSLNLYAYVNNNPLSKTDPDGHLMSLQQFHHPGASVVRENKPSWRII